MGGELTEGQGFENGHDHGDSHDHSRARGLGDHLYEENNRGYCVGVTGTDHDEANEDPDDRDHAQTRNATKPMEGCGPTERPC